MGKALLTEAELAGADPRAKSGFSADCPRIRLQALPSSWVKSPADGFQLAVPSTNQAPGIRSIPLRMRDRLSNPLWAFRTVLPQLSVDMAPSLCGVAGWA
jgi:hypothetical protein